MFLILIAFFTVILWFTFGYTGWEIWKKNIKEKAKPRLATEHMMLNAQLSSFKLRFIIVGPFSLKYALNLEKN